MGESLQALSDTRSCRRFRIHPESGGPHPAPIDALKNEGLNDIPMGKFWIRANTYRVTPDSRFFIKQLASAAHTYGKRFVQAEGSTSIGPQWEEDFAYIRPIRTSPGGSRLWLSR
jgi:hypothetical protein